MAAVKQYLKCQARPYVSARRDGENRRRASGGIDVARNPYVPLSMQMTNRLDSRSTTPAVQNSIPALESSA